MRLDLDVGEYCRKLRAEKQPPYECPFVHCGKVYKSLCGLQYHLLNVDHNTTTAANTSVCDGSPANIPIVPSGRKKSQGTAHQSRTSTADNLTPPSREGLTYSEAQKMVEFEIDNKTTRVCIYEELQVLGLEEAVAAGFNMEEMRLKKATFKQHLDENKLHLPEPSFRVIEDYNISDAPPMPNSYIRWCQQVGQSSMTLLPPLTSLM